MPCPRHGLTLALIYRCRCRVPDRSYTDTQQADACPRHVLHWLS
ncbi:hypothetical protein F383_35537 [Gossypium arboreum]|uniref:Uncharacterized protein n=1 Tax=Gossypium arboreum TaxID=29729 RepID=A0A0B0PXI3_GOSAR|nr:hypothetical protein F383_35537 [Gossypium arboreum]